ncbi:methyltransferase family protein [Hyphobacterium sp.]|uniref:methyltransferase family protein n=1 Tax=Hyphobacterium sp. TaxID=2004662 RepID=UPI003BAD9248
MRPVIPPPIILIFYIAVAYGIDLFSPFDVLLGNAHLLAPLLLGGIGVLIAVLGVIAFRKHETTVSPHAIDKTRTLVTTGIYRFTRNPMYLGMALVLLGAIAWMQDVFALATVPVFIATLNRLQIRPEEDVLSARYGAAYTAYCEKVRRWI